MREPQALGYGCVGAVRSRIRTHHHFEGGGAFRICSVIYRERCREKITRIAVIGVFGPDCPVRCSDSTGVWLAAVARIPAPGGSERFVRTEV